MATSTSGCITVSVEQEDKDCIEITSNLDECINVYAVLTFADNDVEEPIVEESEHDCYTIRYDTTNFDDGASYYVDIDYYGSVYYGGNGTFFYEPPRRNVPATDLYYKIRAKKATSVTEWVEETPSKLPVTPAPILGTPSNPNPSANETITIPITNYEVGTSLYDTPLTTDSGYAVVVSGEISWVLGSDVEVGKTYTLSLVGYDDCSSESETATIDVTINKYEYVQDIDSDECPDLCSEGQYFDCESESCVVNSLPSFNGSILASYRLAGGSEGDWWIELPCDGETSVSCGVDDVIFFAWIKFGDTIVDCVDMWKLFNNISSEDWCIYSREMFESVKSNLIAILDSQYYSYDISWGTYYEEDDCYPSQTFSVTNVIGY